jgi:hypothetical protein
MSDQFRQSRYSVALIAGRYELVRELSSNGDVLEWEGFDSALERQVVVRFLRQELVHDPAAVARFWQTARSAARARTATGERVLDAGTDPETGRPFVVREWPQARHAAADDETEPTVALTVAPRPSSGTPARATGGGRLALLGLVLVAGLGVLAFRAGVQSWLAWVNTPLGQVESSLVLPPVTKPPDVGAQPGAPTATPAALPPTVAPVVGPVRTSAPTAGASPRPTPRATATADPRGGVARRIVNTDGQGVALRASPGGDRLPGKGYDEGDTVTAYETNGQWTRIRGADGREGWVLSVTLGQ